MTLIDQEHIPDLSQNDFGPETLTENLGFIPEVFHFLKDREEDLEKTRPVVTYSVCITIWAFRKAVDQPRRSMPVNFPERIWESFLSRNARLELPSCLEVLEPQLWNFFLNLVNAASIKEEWTEQELTVACAVYGTVLLACIYMFWTEEDLQWAEEQLQAFNLNAD